MTTLIKASSLDAKFKPVLGELEAGRCVAIPTETVYGLAADATNGRAVARIFETKHRPKFNPLICHVSDLAMAKEYGTFNGIAERLAKAFWPGPLTIIVPLRDESGIHDLVSAGLGTIGLRCPEGISREIIECFGKPLAAPSANRSGRISPTTAKHVAEEFYGEDLLIVDDGPCSVGLESTIVGIGGDELTLLRPGAVTVDQLEKQTDATVKFPTVNGQILAPGMMKSHYAPDACLILDCASGSDVDLLLGFGAVDCDINLSEDGDLLEAAANLYAYLKELDGRSPATIGVTAIPKEGLGIAINDRLMRAAAPREETV